MKYMGSKRRMLRNGLGSLIREQSYAANRIVDPFCGSGVLAWYAATNTDKEIIATDLQEYAVILAGAVIGRTELLNVDLVSRNWFSRATNLVRSHKCYPSARRFQKQRWERYPAKSVKWSRIVCQNIRAGSIWNAYGGYYYSPLQALMFDSLRKTVTASEPLRSAQLAGLISAASACAASPGHTAQPFHPTQKGAPYLFEAWRRDPKKQVLKSLATICSQCARVPGRARVADASDVALQVEPGDLVVLDPPYSSVHYSRFYHVLETIARGSCSTVSGAGRYPPQSERPRSDYSLKTRSRGALHTLLERLSDRGATVVLTFPAGESSNGLSGDLVRDMAHRYYDVHFDSVESEFSTLGGNHEHRPARKSSKELILLLSPR